MRKWINAGFVAGVAFLAGCSHARAPRESVAVSGVVKTLGGRPVKGVRLILESTESGEAAATFGFDLDNNGNFEGKAYPGTYAFFLSPVDVELDHDGVRPASRAEAQKLGKSQQLLRSYPASYRSPRNIPSDHHVEVAQGQALKVIVK
jgi:hypothetical protein